MDIQTFDFVRFVPCLEKVGENEPSLRGREHCIEGCLGYGTMVGMVDVTVAIKNALGVTSYDSLRFVVADQTG